jgi:tetratricopeptide (TPR) repeat protein
MPTAGEVYARHAAHYLGVLREAEQLYRQGGGSVKASFEVFDRDSLNILEAQAWTVRCAAQDERAAELCFAYGDTANLMVHRRLTPRERLLWLEPAMQNTPSNDAGAQAAIAHKLGIAYQERGDHKRAIRINRHNLSLSRELGNAKGEADALNGLAVNYYAIGKARRAAFLYQKAVAISQRISDITGEAAAQSNWGLALSELGNPREGITHLRRALEIYEEVGDRIRIADISGNLAQVSRTMGDIAASLQYCTLQIDIVRILARAGKELSHTGL